MIYSALTNKKPHKFLFDMQYSFDIQKQESFIYKDKKYQVIQRTHVVGANGARSHCELYVMEF